MKKIEKKKNSKKDEILLFLHLNLCKILKWKTTKNHKISEKKHLTSARTQFCQSLRKPIWKLIQEN